MVINANQSTPSRRVNQAVHSDIPQPNKIWASTPYDFAAHDLPQREYPTQEKCDGFFLRIPANPAGQEFSSLQSGALHYAAGHQICAKIFPSTHGAWCIAHGARCARGISPIARADNSAVQVITIW